MAMKKSPKTKLKRSPLQTGFVKKFQKIRDDKARKLIKGSKLMLRSINKGQVQVVGNRSYLNKSARKKLKSPKAMKRNKNTRQTTRNKKATANCSDNKQPPKDVEADSDDDCILVENSESHITIVDDDGDDGYQTLYQSFANRVSSTPCATKTKQSKLTPGKGGGHTIELQPNQYPPSFAKLATCNQYGMQRAAADQANGHFFVDVSGNARLGNPNYNSVAPLKDKSNIGDDDNVIVLDETAKDDKNSTLKKAHESSESSSDDDSSSEEEEEESEEGELKESAAVVDDSVIFISDTNAHDFISINSPADVNVRKTQNAPNAPNKTAMYSELFTRSEKKQLEAYNTNAYNPHAGQVFTSKKRMVIIDGSNVAFKHSLDKGFSVKGLKIAIEYFERMGHEVKAVIPQFRMNNNKSTDPIVLNALHKGGKIVQTPCKNLPGLTSTSYDDRFILQLASELDAAVVSNDNYRDLMHENPAFKKIIETRVVGYTWCNDIFILPKDPYGKWGPTLDMILNRS